jgi:hypothetical protein
VVTEALRVMDVPKDLPNEMPANTLVAQFPTGDLADADENSDQPNILEEGDEDTPLMPTPPGALTVPNFKGKTMRAVLAEAANRGLTILPAGSGVARAQDPPAGSIMQRGARIRVQFVR